MFPTGIPPWKASSGSWNKQGRKSARELHTSTHISAPGRVLRTSNALCSVLAPHPGGLPTECPAWVPGVPPPPITPGARPPGVMGTQGRPRLLLSSAASQLARVTQRLCIGFFTWEGREGDVCTGSGGRSVVVGFSVSVQERRR